MPSTDAPHASADTSRHLVASPVAFVITAAAAAASVAIALTFGATVEIVRTDVVGVLVILCLTLALQGFAVEIYGHGSLGVSAIGMISAGIALGAGPALVIAVVAAVFQWLRRRGMVYKAIFDAANFALAAAAAAVIYHAVPGTGSVAVHLAAATLAGLGYAAVNCSLLCVVMSLAEETGFRTVWKERFHWARYHLASFGPLAAAATLAYDRLGIIGLTAFTLPPALLVYTMRQYLARTQEAVAEIREANAQLAARNDDLHELFEFAAGLAHRSHDRESVLAYAEQALSRITGGAVTVSSEQLDGGVALTSGGMFVGAVAIRGRASFDAHRWARLSETILPQLATSLESAHLIERVRKTHRDTIAALSRSMEAKDYYTGGHTERVAEISVAIARRLGLEGPELEAIEIGALLHDIGKIGIPEGILHKQAALDDEEWKVMKEHPVVSDYILSEVELHPSVRQAARSSHERMDGAGYPDGLVGEAIPLAARIVAVADAFDALTTDRPYRRARHTLAALDELREGAGAQFCPKVIAALETVYRDEPQLLGLGVLRAVDVA